MRKLLPDLFLIGYSLVLIVVGVTGVVAAGWELTRIFGLDPLWLGLPEGATFLNQYRVLRAAEAAFGLFCLCHRRDILAGGPNGAIFLAGCALGIFARSWSWAIDGTPRTAFIVFLILEAATFLLVWTEARRGRDQIK